MLKQVTLIPIPFVAEPGVIYTTEVKFPKHYLVCDDEIGITDKFYHKKTNKVYECSDISLCGIFAKEEVGFFPFVACKKVVAMPNQIGWLRDWGIPGRTLITPVDIQLILSKTFNGKCSIEMKEVCPNYDGAHMNKDCSCKTGFIEVINFVDNKVIINI